MPESASPFATDASTLSRLFSRDPVFDEVVYNAEKPLCIALAIVCAIFVILGFLDDEAGYVWFPIIFTDALSVGFYLACYLALSTGYISSRLTYPLGVCIGIVPLGNALLAFWLTENEFFLSYLPMIAIGCGAFMLSLPWLLLVFVIMLCAGFVVGIDVLSVITVFRYLPALMGAFIVSILILVIRRWHIIESQRALIAVKAESEERKRAEASLAHVQRLESIGKLVSGIAHDFNNLLTVIIGYTESLMLDIEDGSALRKDLNEIHTASEKAAALSSKLLAFSRQQFLRPQVVQLNRLVEGARSLIERSLQSNVRLAIKLEPNAGSVNVDPLQMEQVLINLALNARDAMAESGGELTIVTQVIDAERGDDNSLPEDQVELRVTDTGCGMPDEVRERVFEPFFTTKEVGSGTGLGLAMVYGIVMQSEGTVTIDSVPGQGTTVSIVLPRVDAGSGQSETMATAGTAKTMLQNVRVLLVDDEEKVRDIVRRMLERKGCKVMVASCVDQALELAGREPFDVVLSDIAMPGKSGFDLVRELGDKGYLQPILLMSGFPVDQFESTRDSSVPLLHKPFKAEELIQALKKIMSIEL